MQVSAKACVGATYHMTMQFGGTVVYVDQVSPVVDFYRRAFGLNVRFFDKTLGFARRRTHTGERSADYVFDKHLIRRTERLPQEVGQENAM